MVKTECAEQRPRFECEPLPGGATLIRLYEDEQEVTREAVSNMDTPRNGWQYTTYEMITALPAGGLSAAPDAWATLVKQYDYRYGFYKLGHCKRGLHHSHLLSGGNGHQADPAGQQMAAVHLRRPWRPAGGGRHVHQRAGLSRH